MGIASKIRTKRDSRIKMARGNNIVTTTMHVTEIEIFLGFERR